MLFQNDMVKLAKVLNLAVSKIKSSEVKDEQLPLDETGEDTQTATDNETQDKSVPEDQDTESQKYPNSGKKWTREDEEKLEFLFKAGKTVDDLTEIFGRKQKGIESRLEKLGLIEK